MRNKPEAGPPGPCVLTRDPCLRGYHGGGVVFGASLAARIAEVLTSASRPERPFPELTERETEVLDLRLDRHR